MDVFGKEDECVGDVTLEALLAGQVDFLIPPYQRGYRWRGREVTALIDDLYAFFTGKKNRTDERYCLQPLVVQPTVNVGKYIVVDGQQRLTTLAILLLSKSISVGTGRVDILKVLADRSMRLIDDGRAGQVWTIKPREDGSDDGKLSSECRENALRIAMRHLGKIEKICENLKDIVFVYYKLPLYKSKADDKVARETFRRINAGKVSLSSSELLRALFFEPDAIGVAEQHEIAAEWEQIQTRLKDDTFWHMFNEDDVPVHRRMDQFFSIVAKCEGKGATPRMAFDKIESDIANAGERKADKISGWWTAAMDLFWMLQYCYSDLRVYHYVGWLRRCSDDSFATLYELYSNNKKDGGFADVLRRRINKKIGNRLTLVQKSDPEENNGCFKTLNYCYDDDKKDLRAFLLLVNLEMMNQMYARSPKTDVGDFDSDVGFGYCRFPFPLYDATSWDVEHVASHTANPMEDLKERRQWAEGVRDETENIKLKERLVAWLEKIGDGSAVENESLDSGVDKEFDNLYKDWIDGVGRNMFPTELQKNRIGNLVLLDSETNRGYGNAIFPIKRRIIHEVETGVKVDAAGNATPTAHRFVLAQTSTVFKKSVSANNPKTLQAWTVDDIENNEAEILRLLKV